ncbi:hypothetical protein Vretimale_1367 [Volvox reticuliferus]|uniref:O-fucosyltransferase family protein n=1 Tax=Volvox reticuliferus TaxID=1737510 RepID=A0A8J4D441_9CHLO|nr:hypothetical protein Vretifemale_10756 [Volvox reticuliferus]GIL95309.1 hypothetical protein Vretimale_1367 [Volvox reticuliferus]
MAADSPFRPQRRSLSAHRYAAAIRAISPAGPGRWALYVSLLLVGYLAGTTVRFPFPRMAAPSLFTPSISGLIANRVVARTTDGDAGTFTHADIGRSTDSSFRERLVGALEGQTQRRRVAEDVAAATTTAAVAAEAAAEAVGDSSAQLQPQSRTLRFQVCNGFANQRLSIIYGALLAVRLDRTAVLPVLIDNGLQRTDNTILANTDNQVLFSDMYDQPYFIKAMAAAGLRVVAPEEAPPMTTYAQVPLAQYGWSAAAPLAEHFGDVLHLAVDCPLFKMAASELTAADWDFMWAVLDALRPNPQAAALLDRAVARIAERQLRNGREGAAKTDAAASSSSFNFIHLRIENDWVAHCL